MFLLGNTYVCVCILRLYCASQTRWVWFWIRLLRWPGMVILKQKEDGGKRLCKKAWGFNLFPVFISPLGDKPCAIKNISYSHWLAAWLHLWRRLKDKMKGTQKMALKDTFVYDRHNLISCMCMPWKAILMRVLPGFPVYMNGKWDRRHTARLKRLLHLKSKVKVIWTKISKHIWPSWGTGLFRKWKCQHGIVIILRVSQPLTL